MRLPEERNVSRRSDLLTVLFVALFGIAACQPVYVSETYRQSYGFGPTYGPGYGTVMAPTVVVREPVFIPAPVVVEKKTIIKEHFLPGGTAVLPVRPGHCDRRLEKCWRNGLGHHVGQPG